MGLEWVRLDSNIAQHDKMLHLLTDRSVKKWQASTNYMFGLAWSGGAATDGVIPFHALDPIRATKETAEMLVQYGLWRPVPTGWEIPNYAVRQELAIVTEAKRAAQRAGALKGNCIRYHGKDCGCWREQLNNLG